MGTWDDGKGGLAHREGIRQEHWLAEVGAARSATDLCSALPCFGRGVGADPIPFGARLSSNHRTVPWVQAANFDQPSMIALGSSRPLMWLSQLWKGCRQPAQNRRGPRHSMAAPYTFGRISDSSLPAADEAARQRGSRFSSSRLANVSPLFPPQLEPK